jgi:hypothetical protein
MTALILWKFSFLNGICFSQMGSLAGPGTGRGGLIRDRPPEKSSARRGTEAGFRSGSAEEIGGQKGDAGGHAADGGHGMQVFEGGAFGGGIVHGGSSAILEIVLQDINTSTRDHGNYKN